MAFCVALMHGKVAYHHVLSSAVVGRLKYRATGLDASLSFCLTSCRCARKQSPNLLPVLPMYIFLHKVHFMQ